LLRSALRFTHVPAAFASLGAQADAPRPSPSLRSAFGFVRSPAALRSILLANSGLTSPRPHDAAGRAPDEMTLCWSGSNDSAPGVRSASTWGRISAPAAIP